MRDGEILSDGVLDELDRSTAFSRRRRCARGSGVIERLLLKMRFELDLYINQRPFVGTAPGGRRLTTRGDP